MSHVVSIKTKLTDLDAIKATCKELGLIFKQGQKTYAWYGRTMGDYPLPAGFTAADLGQCEHAIQVPGAEYEIGLARAKDGNGFVMLFDFWGTNKGEPILKAIGGQNAGKFLQSYGLNKAEREAKKLGHSVRRQVLASGAVNLIVTGGRL
jgi:hypothetical protein